MKQKKLTNGDFEMADNVITGLAKDLTDILISKDKHRFKK